MSARPSIVFLFDLDVISSIEPTANDVEKRDSSQENVGDHSFIRVLRYISMSILNHFTLKQVNIQWGYRFYSSSSYKLTHKAGFHELSEQSLEEFEENLNVRYEQHLSLTHSEAPTSNMSKASILGRTLQDIATDFNWKTPTDSLTPTRKGRKTGKQLAEQNLQNLVFIFTEVPLDETMNMFCNVNGKQNQTLSPKTVMDCILTKDLVKKFNEFQLSLNFVDLSVPSKKDLLSKIVFDLRGTIINSAALISPFSFSHIFLACRMTPDQPNASKSCPNCQKHQLRPKFTLQMSRDVVEVDVHCWNTACDSSSSLILERDSSVPKLNCIPVFQSAVATASLLCYDALYLLSTKSSFFEISTVGPVVWVGKWNEHLFAIVNLNSHVASMVFPSSDWALTLLESEFRVATTRSELLHRDSSGSGEIEAFVEQIVSASCPLDIHSVSDVDPLPETVDHQKKMASRLRQLKSNYTDRKALHSRTHWEMLKECFQPGTVSQVEGEQAKDCVANCLNDKIKSSETFPSVASADTIKMKIGNNRIQNLRASQLLQKSQEVRARNDEIEREKQHKEKVAADEKREKKWKEVESYMIEMRQSLSPEDIAQLAAPAGHQEPLDREKILERLLQSKKAAYSPQVEDWQLYGLSQVIASTVLYSWKEPDDKTFELGHEAICKHLLRTPASISRSSSKEDKIHEYKFQILLRLEMCWTVPSLASEEEVLQDVTSLLQLLSIHSSPKVMSGFFQETLVVNFENMLPDLLVNLADEMSQPIPASLCELVSNLNARGTPSPALSSGLLSVNSASSNHNLGSQQPAARELRSRTLSRQPSINILQHKKQIALPAKAEKVPAASNLMAGPSNVKKEESCEVGRVRRSLQFGLDTPEKGGKMKSPSKLATPKRQLGVSNLSFHEFTTPNKTTGVILAPETPSRLRSGGKSVRKTDGVHVVGESPEVKQDALRRSPRRLQAALALRRRASFYSTLNNSDASAAGSSRHWARAESQVWSEKAKASAALVTEDGNALRPGHSAKFLFSRILSCNETDANRTESLVPPTPLKDVPELAELALCQPLGPQSTVVPQDVAIVSLGTPLKAGKSTGLVISSATVTDSAGKHLLSVPNSECAVFGLQSVISTPLKTPSKTPLQTPLKTPRHVQFDLSFKPATPASKTLPSARSILKSPVASRNSPFQNKTPLKASENIDKPLVHVLDETNFDGGGELDLLSPCKPVDQLCTLSSAPKEHNSEDDVVHKLDERTLLPEDEIQLQSPVKPTGKSTVSPLILRRSPRSSLHTGNFFQRNPNWTVVDYRRPSGSAPVTNGRRSQKGAKESEGDEQAEDPYDFANEDENATGTSQRSFYSDSSSHKRKLFQTSAEKTAANKKRRVLRQPSPVPEVDVDAAPSTPTLKFQPPMNGSLFHLENSPLLSTLDSKLNL